MRGKKEKGKEIKRKKEEKEVGFYIHTTTIIKIAADELCITKLILKSKISILSNLIWGFTPHSI